MLRGALIAVSPRTRLLSGLFRPQSASQCTVTKRYTSTVPNSALTSQVKIVFNEDDHRKINTTWLRENCQCDQCFNHSTRQRMSLCYDLTSQQVGVNNLCVDGNVVAVTWDDGHLSKFPQDWLSAQLAIDKSGKSSQLFWNAEGLARAPLQRVDFTKTLADDDSLKELLSSLVKYGIGIVDNVPASIEGTQEISERVCHIQETFFGRMWSFTANQARGDTAYTNIALGAHTDATYLTSPVGIQVFHCLHHDGKGGETLLVDGFNAAEQLRLSHPHHYDFLSRLTVKHHYLEAGVHVESMDSILKTHPVTGDMECLRYNHYDRAPLSMVDQDDMGHFYEALVELSRIISSPENEFWLKLKPGTVLFVNNWRVLHGRAAFTGNRRVCGCYLPNDNWMSRARIMGVA